MSLSDKEIKADNFANDNGFFWSEDLKEAIKKLKEDLCKEFIEREGADECRIPQNQIMFKIKQVFGKDLVEEQK